MKFKPFKPAWWLRNPHCQTLWSTLCRRKIRTLALTRERVELADGDFIDLDWVNPGDGPIVLILHGLEGSSQSPYASGLLQAVAAQGWRGVVMHFRSCSGELNRLLRTYHSGETTDLLTLIKKLQAREPQTPIAAVGFSLGGNVLLKSLGELGKETLLVAAVAVSVPFELEKAAYRLERGFSRVYARHLLKSLRSKIARKMKAKVHSNLPPLSKLKSIREFDDKVTAPLHGFLGVADYYSRSSSRQYLRAIQIPTLILHAKDDPFMTPDVIPEQHELSADIILEVSEQGGHVGFIGGHYPWRAEYWLESRIPLFLKEYLSVLS